jgi:NADH-quinone oxidoreductase subunit N
MTFQDLLDGLIRDTLNRSVPLFAPELCVIATIVLLLLVRLFNADRRLPGSVLAIAGTVAALVLSALQFWLFRDAGPEAGDVGLLGRLYQVAPAGAVEQTPIFTGLLIYDPFTVFFRIFLLLFALFVIYLTLVSGIPDQDDAPDFYVLLLGSTLGMMLMCSANHLLMVFLAVEMTSVPSYAMVGFLKGRRQSSEAALKYVVYGAGAAGVMLYGISLLSGLLGTAHLPELASALGDIARSGASLSEPTVRTMALAILMVLVGIAFKLSVFPFHFWCPDAFEGAAAEVGGFLSVASKGAAFAMLVRFCMALVGAEPGVPGPLAHLYSWLGVGLGLTAAATATFGNLAAYAQNNLKRLLAYSTIAHAGYMLMAVSALMVILNAPGGAGTSAASRTDAAAYCIQGLIYYLAVYFFMNLGAFAIVAVVRNQSFSEELPDYSGLVRQSPALAICMLVCLFSLIGLPPMGGFVGKLMVFYSVVKAAALEPVMWVVLAAGVLNTVFSLFYYVRVMRYMFLGEVPEGARTVDVPLGSDAGRYALLVTVPVVLLGVFVDPLSAVARDVATWLF